MNDTGIQASGEVRKEKEKFNIMKRGKREEKANQRKKKGNEKFCLFFLGKNISKTVKRERWKL